MKRLTIPEDLVVEKIDFERIYDSKYLHRVHCVRVKYGTLWLTRLSIICYYYLRVSS